VLTRGEVVSAASQVGILMESAEAFDAMLFALKKALIAFNSELAMAHARLGLRYSISIVVEPEAQPVAEAPGATLAEGQEAHEAD
jgi:hypothetical protein